MSEVRSLMRVDALQIRSYWKFMIAAALFVLVFVLTGNITVATPIAGTIGLMVAMGPISNAEVTGTDRLYGTLPVSRRSVVKAHYAVGISCLLMVAVVLLAGGIGALVTHADTGEGVVAALGLTLALIVIFALYAPIMMRFGSRAGGIILILTFGLVGVLGGTVLSLLGQVTGLDGVAFPNDFPMEAWVGSLFVLVAVVTVVVSYAVAVRIYERQDH